MMGQMGGAPPAGPVSLDAVEKRKLMKDVKDELKPLIN
jgi:hypothetical protein